MRGKERRDGKGEPDKITILKKSKNLRDRVDEVHTRGGR